MPVRAFILACAIIWPAALFGMAVDVLIRLWINCDQAPLHIDLDLTISKDHAALSSGSRSPSLIQILQFPRIVSLGSSIRARPSSRLMG
jgi:hypothetical protein